MKNLVTVYFVVSLKPRRPGGRAWYEVADNKTNLPDGARVIGGTQTIHRNRAMAFKQDCIQGRFWGQRKRMNRDRYHADKLQREQIRQTFKRYGTITAPKAAFDWSKYEAMTTA